MKLFTEPMGAWKDLEHLRSALQKNKTCYITGVTDAAKPHMTKLLSEGFDSVLFVTYSERRAMELLEEMRFFFRDFQYFPARDMLFYKADIGAGLIDVSRMQTYQKLLESGKTGVMTTFDALMNVCAAPALMKKNTLTIRRGGELKLDRAAERLVHIGYERAYKAELAGQFAIRGDILDVYPLTEEHPYRIELWGDEVEQIRSFDAQTQRSIGEEESISIFPAAEDFEGAEKASTVLDFFDWERTICILDEPVRLSESAAALQQEITAAYLGRKESGYGEDEELNLVLDEEQIFVKLTMHSMAALSVLDTPLKLFRADCTATISSKSLSGYQSSFELLVKDLGRYRKNKYKIILLSPSRTRAERLAKDIFDTGLSAAYIKGFDRTQEDGEIVVAYGRLAKGFEYPMLRMVVITEGDIFVKRGEKRKKPKLKKQGSIKSFHELHVGDYVVHENHGIGIYRGIEKVEVEHVVKDYMKIEYAHGSNLYILATQLDMIQKYAASDAKGLPKLSNLGTQEWSRTKGKVRKAVEEIAADLVELYAKRQEAQGYVYEQDTVWQREFEELFPFDETADQLRAIEDTKRDMESGKVMDRLICGDVGFGKTEIALRAAFKAVQNGKQVAYLVPTTILAKQHYDTFTQRLKDYPVNIDLLCRFRTQTEQKKTVKNVVSGDCDIVIGTHRVLSKDVTFRDLGLLIIDEEQRFGVAHKEKIKKLKTNVDVLSLSATPIPRTLHMSLSGIRDMSLLEEPPIDRMPIQTYVMEYHDEMVREAVERELAREGQVYFVYNNIETIADMAIRLQKLIPNSTIAYAHGKMPERDLEQIMFQFINGEIDVLVSTTIVETGLDIPNVNTIIICNAERFGLSQLYQLRGRVGRSNRTAYAFLMYKRDKVLSEVAEKRLGAIREFTELGSGIKIAMRDLEIRGAGNILGQSQSGHMEAVGYDLYCKLLSEAVKKAKGEGETVDFDTSIELIRDAYIPDTYITSEMEKLDMYKRIAALSDEKEKDDLTDEMLDRFGELPPPVTDLLRIAMLKARAHTLYLTAVKETKSELQLHIYPQAPVDPLKVTKLVRDYRGLVKLIPDADKPRFICDKKQMGGYADIMGFLDEFLGLFAKCQNNDVK